MKIDDINKEVYIAQCKMIKQTKFSHSTLGKVLKKQKSLMQEYYL